MTTDTKAQIYWNNLADIYQQETTIEVNDFHYGPLVPGDHELQLLPPDLAGLSCLEVGCGAAQNSVFLALQGAVCTAFDISRAQINHATELAREQGVDITLLQGDMDNVPELEGQQFDLIHSSYALAFCDTPQALLTTIADLLKPGGQLLLSTGHPLFAAEWLELDGEGGGAFVTDYFHPPPDTRNDDAGGTASCLTYPVSTVANWILDAGLSLTSILEPPACSVESKHLPPYISEQWVDLLPQLEKIPVVVIYAAVKPE